jgi:omega-3 fatty acid desaturase (delta-15 desaturase)
MHRRAAAAADDKATDATASATTVVGDELGGVSPRHGNTLVGDKLQSGGGVGVMPDVKGTALTIPSLTEIQKILPPDCLRAETSTSLYYVGRSIVLVTCLIFAFVNIRSSETYENSAIVRALVIAFYWFMQGTLFWGIFVLGHDCGHGSFSSSSRLNWAVGNALHTSILVPYESWRVTHRHHHKNTGHIDNDEIFFPLRESQFMRSVKLAPFLMGFAWFYYIVRGHFPRNVFHLNPNDPLFVSYHSQHRVTASVISLLVWLLVLWRCAVAFGWGTMGLIYFGPLVVFGSWLVVTTFLHHQEENTPWFAEETWDYVKGNLSSIDRSYWPFDDIVHNIGTHQIHHLFPIIPHYKLGKATAAFREAYPHLVRKSDQTALPAFFKAMSIYRRQVPLPKSANYWVFK